MTVKVTKCDAQIAIDADGGALCDKPAEWCSLRELVDGGGRFQLFFCPQHKDRAYMPVPEFRLLRVDRIAVDDGNGVH
jgi:hypothetical protein